MHFRATIYIYNTHIRVYASTCTLCIWVHTHTSIRLLYMNNCRCVCVCTTYGTTLERAIVHFRRREPSPKNGWLLCCVSFFVLLALSLLLCLPEPDEKGLSHSQTLSHSLELMIIKSIDIWMTFSVIHSNYSYFSLCAQIDIILCVCVWSSVLCCEQKFINQTINCNQMHSIFMVIALILCSA